MDKRLLVGARVVVGENHAAEGDSAKHVDGNDTRRLLFLLDEGLVNVLFRLAIAAQILDLVLRETANADEHNKTEDRYDQEYHEIEGSVVVMSRYISCDDELD